METLMKQLLLLASLMLGCTVALADTLSLKAGHPESYVVKKGDTLWGISEIFLKNPWRWPALWGANPQVANPHLIYPGDKLTLIFVNGEPRLVLKPHLSKSPAGRVTAKNGAIPLIDFSLIEPYFLHRNVVPTRWFKSQPMVVAGESPSRHHVVSDVIYVEGELVVGDKLGIYQEGRMLTRANGEALGVEVILAASGRVIESGPVSKLEILTSFREAKAGYRVLAIEDDALASAYLMPRSAQLTAPTTVLASGEDHREMGKFDVAYIDRGKNSDIEVGQVFSIFKEGDKIVYDNAGQPVPSVERSRYDKVLANLVADKAVQLPDLYSGKLMVIKVFDEVSMGIILESGRPVRVADKLAFADSLVELK